MKSNLNDIIYLALSAETKSPSAKLPDGGTLFVRHPSIAELSDLYALSQQEISANVAPLELVQAVYKHNPDSFWGIFFQKAETPENEAKFIGYYGFLHLNAAGKVALEDGTFNGVNPDFGHLIEEGGRPSIVYVWAIVAKKIARMSLPLIARALGKDRYGGVPIYAKAGTLGGLSAIKGYGFVGARPSSIGLGDLFRLDPEGAEAETERVVKEGFKWN